MGLTKFQEQLSIGMDESSISVKDLLGYKPKRKENIDIDEIYVYIYQEVSKNRTILAKVIVKRTVLKDFKKVLEENQIQYLVA